ncbi:kinase domain protein, putative (macronuclear) [Tetrahymena thermophila SB210]|uniref:Kinase domain protein, putative n=1 Tax=Tetrahymena thermophila (strain SB210) TaxID=312017 RepID=Q24DC5_TETTS|nr:kinase domain protein, putative [Tetrahymena thermophila SB210]EAS05780.2 kinase domain protein, putative [Tetrahymena thermophila SB210]|eukprot:XP_001026025.2 kinase domain protein, putative [Tetrahymena thermophila SB210]
MKLKKLVLKQDQNNVKSVQQLKDTVCKQLVETLALNFNFQDYMEDFESFKQNPIYKYIHSRNDLYQNIVQDIKKCSNLASVNLLFNHCSLQMLSENWFKNFLEAFNHCQKLTKFAINVLSNGISIRQARILGNLLSTSDNLLDVNINLQFHSLQDQHLKGLTSGLMKLKKIQILILDISHNLIRDQGALLLGNSISKCLSLKNLTVYLECNYLSENGIESFLEGVFKCKQLDYLDLDIGSSIEISQSTLKSFHSGLINLRYLQYLSFVYDSNKLRNSSVDNLCQNLTELKCLLHIKIDLYNNQIFYEGLKQMLDKLYEIKDLRTINLLLKNNSIEFEKSITKQKNKLLRLKRLILFHLEY